MGARDLFSKRIALTTLLFLTIAPISFLSMASGAYSLTMSDVVSCSCQKREEGLRVNAILAKNPRPFVIVEDVVEEASHGVDNKLG